jgi:streptomycin 3"-adenylyltransferase
MNIEPVIEDYLNSLTVRVENALKDNLIGLYVFGSLAYNDFAGRSDIDVLAVSAKNLPRGVKEKLADAISHENLNCPAAGLDFILANFDCASSAPEIPTFEFSISTGENWETEVEYGGVYDELLLHFAICRKFGQTLYGLAPVDVFAVVPDERLKEILRKIIEWHRAYIFHPFHDPFGHYAVLNACRAWRFAEEKVLCSKTGGGEWLLVREPMQKVVKDALDIRSGKYNQKLDRISVERFLDLAKAAFAT